MLAKSCLGFRASALRSSDNLLVAREARGEVLTREAGGDAREWRIDSHGVFSSRVEANARPAPIAPTMGCPTGKTVATAPIVRSACFQNDTFGGQVFRAPEQVALPILDGLDERPLRRRHRLAVPV